jgi:hypothetical protein
VYQIYIEGAIDMKTISLSEIHRPKDGVIGQLYEKNSLLAMCLYSLRQMYADGPDEPIDLNVISGLCHSIELAMTAMSEGVEELEQVDMSIGRLEET